MRNKTKKPSRRIVVSLFCLFCGTDSYAESITRLDQIQCRVMKEQHVISEHSPVKCNRLRTVSFNYTDFNHHVHYDGNIVVMDAAARTVLTLFQKLYHIDFPIASAKPVTAFLGNDLASMKANNTSAFNDRAITGGTVLSLHAYGLAIDLNPIQNPFITRSGSTITVLPPAGEAYTNRALNSTHQGKGMVESVVAIFCRAGFPIWGGHWHDPIDYQHFQVSRRLAERLAQLPAADSKRAFDATAKGLSVSCNKRRAPMN